MINPKKITKGLTLAEIFNFNKNDYSKTKNEKRMEFGSN